MKSIVVKKNLEIDIDDENLNEKNKPQTSKNDKQGRGDLNSSFHSVTGNKLLDNNKADMSLDDIDPQLDSKVN
jgi:hypothetical protein